MKKTSSFAAIAVLLAVVAAIFVSSCSSEYTEEENCSLSENEKIEKLAEEYGIHFECDDRNRLLPKTRADFENLFQTVSSVVGDYELIGESFGDSLVATAFQSGFLYSPPIESELPEYGTGEFDGSDNEFSATLCFSWNLANHQYCSMYVTDLSFEYTRLNIDYCAFLGSDTNVISFAFSAYNTSIENITIYLRGEGTYNISTEIGALSIDVTAIVRGGEAD